MDVAPAGRPSAVPFTGQRLDVGGLVAAFDPAVYGDARAARIRFEGGPVRWYADGRTPTSGAGTLALDSEVITLDTPTEIAAFQAVRTGVTNGTAEARFAK
jgi:hypothetical protein